MPLEMQYLYILYDVLSVSEFFLLVKNVQVMSDLLTDVGRCDSYGNYGSEMPLFVIVINGSLFYRYSKFWTMGSRTSAWLCQNLNVGAHFSKCE